VEGSGTLTTFFSQKEIVMVPLPSTVQDVIVGFAPLFSKRVFAHVKLLMAGAILVPGKRMVTSVLRVMGKGDDPHFQRYHRVFNRAQWSALHGGKILLRLLVETFVPSGPVLLGVDETIERRWGAKIAARGIYRDPVRSSHAHVVKASGVRWVCLMLLTAVPWTKRIWALPVVTVLSPSERYYQQRGREAQTLLERAEQALKLVRRWLPERELQVVADSTYAALEWLEAVRQVACVITRLRLDAALYDPAPPRQPRQNGRPRKKGKRLPTLAQVLADETTAWENVTIEAWYGEGNRAVEVTSATAVWYHTGKPVVPIRWVVIRDPAGGFEPQALLSTDLDLSPKDIVASFVRRWQIEVTFEEARAHLGLETQRQWNDRAIARTTPALLALYSLVTLMAHALLPTESMPVRRATWYRKEQATFADTIALVRRCLWAATRFSMSDEAADMVKVPRTLVERLTEAVCYAA
jgi:DDE superfamily endonuclease